MIMTNEILRAFTGASRVLTVGTTLLFALPVMAGDISYPDNSYSTGNILTADDLNAKFNEIKADVNDNDGRISVLEGATPLPADPNQLLNGTYVITAQQSCIEATDIDAGLVPSGFVTSTYNVFSGSAMFDGAGNANLSITGTYVAVPFDHTSAPVQIGTFSTACVDTYTVNPDWTVVLAGTCTTTFTGGPISGETGTINGAALQGHVNAQGTFMVTTYVDGNVDQVNLSTGYSADRVCSDRTTWIRQ
jgi:hypothetical protein